MPKSRSRRLAFGLIAAVGVALPWIPMAASAARDTADEPVESKTVTAPVMIDGAQLFRVRGVPALPAEERARLIAERIATVAADFRVAPESLRIVEEGGRSDIMAGDRRIVSVVEADADVEDVSRPTLATTNLHRIQG